MWRYVNHPAVFGVFILPPLILPLGLTAGNWGQHALVDTDDPSITLIVVAVRLGYNILPITGACSLHLN